MTQTVRGKSIFPLAVRMGENFNIWWNLNVDLEDPVKNADNVVKDLCSSNLHGHQSLFSNTYLSGVYPASMFIVTQNNQVL